MDGITSNLAESFFACLRRMMMGTHHRMSNRYLIHYTNEIGWQEDARRKSALEKFNDWLKKCLQCTSS
ncbi:MAG: hypothetical protein GKC53_03945 [Neisseriaceae bacterium]|nr:MAG: hypothetical protein GKC53_03945 [Neisseriaceae bacterium]